MRVSAGRACSSALADPLFVLSRSRRILFVNRAWETLTCLTAADVLGLRCRRIDPLSANESNHEAIANVLWPPPVTKVGASARVRRLGLSQPPHQNLWEIEFLPLVSEGKSLAILGRIRVVTGPRVADDVPLPRSLIDARQRACDRYDLSQWPCELPAMRRLGDQALLAATTSVPILLVGQPGVGKEHLARCIHRLASSAEGAFVSLDCERLPTPAIEFHLQPPSKKPVGVGTIYFNEPGSLSRDLQLRLVQQIEAGGLDQRIMAGTTKDVTQQIKSGRLLDTLYHALTTMVLYIPPLRDRISDLRILVSYMIERCNDIRGHNIIGFAPETWELLRDYPWPGNLNELYTTIQSAARRAKSDLISPSDLPAQLRLRLRMDAIPERLPERSLNLDQILEGAERRLIQLALRRHSGSKSKAAAALGLTRPRLARRMESLGVVDANESIDDLERE